MGLNSTLVVILVVSSTVNGLVHRVNTNEETLKKDITEECHKQVEQDEGRNLQVKEVLQDMRERTILEELDPENRRLDRPRRDLEFIRNIHEVNQKVMEGIRKWQANQDWVSAENKRAKLIFRGLVIGVVILVKTWIYCFCCRKKQPKDQTQGNENLVRGAYIPETV